MTSIAWTDVETNDVDERLPGATLLQLAAIVTDSDFNELGEIETKFYFPPRAAKAAYEHANDFVREMHTKTGLWDQLSDDANPTHEEFDETFSAWLKELQPEPGVLRFGGNSITLDRNFMRQFLPKSFAHLSYRSLDMSSIEEFLVNTDGRKKFHKAYGHEAMDDIRASLDQARYHRELSKIPF